MGSEVLRSNVRRILREDERQGNSAPEQTNMMKEQMDHIHKLILRADGCENILKLVQAEKMITEMIMARNVMEHMGGG